jgi:serine protease Do
MLAQRAATYLAETETPARSCTMSAEFTITRKTVLGLVAAALLGSTVMTSAMLVPQPHAAFADTAAALAVDPTKSFAPLVERVMPAVVSVEVKFKPVSNDVASDGAEGGDNGDAMPPGLKEFFDQFPQFKNHMPNQQFGQPRGPAMAEGSGFLISADGYAVTNNHVVKDADEVKVTFQNGDHYDAKVIGTDPKTDLALLKISADKAFPFVKLADEEAKVGDWVMAVGNPFGLGGTVTAGIVSARGRDIGSGPYDDFLQIDASINKGNSGGPSFNLTGDVVGVNSAIFSPSGGSVGIGFAIPASIVKDVVQSLKSDGAVTRGWLGVQIQPVTDDIAQSLGLKEAKGAIVADLTENSPGQKAGIKQGDTILKANGEEIADARDLARTIAKVKPGTDIPVEIYRDGKPETITVKIGAMPGETPKMAGVTAPDKGFDLSSLGLKLAPADDGAGVKITDVDPNSPAAERGLQPGDIILEVAGNEVTHPSDVADAFKGAKEKRVLMLVRSGDNQRYIAIPAARS